MNIYQSIEEYDFSKGPVVTMGVFDGVHKGHFALLFKTIERAKELNTHSVVITYYPHPKHVLNINPSLKMLQTIDERVQRFAKLGFDDVIIIPFSREFASIPPDVYIKKYLVGILKVKAIIIGYDHNFGSGKDGGYDLLHSMSKEYDFEVDQISRIDYDQQTVSSTAIREALKVGDVSLAASYLDYNYSIFGKVITGNRLGKGLGFPTVNLKLTDDEKILPAIGVYAVLIKWNMTFYKAMCNIGTRPTIEGERLTIEAHIFDFDLDIYNENISINFIERLRDEQRFESINALVEQLVKDKKKAIKLLEKY